MNTHASGRRMLPDLFYGASFSANIGTISLFIGAGAEIGPWLGGLIHDLTGSYRHAFWIAQYSAFVSVCCVWMVSPGSVAQKSGR